MECTAHDDVNERHVNLQRVLQSTLKLSMPKFSYQLFAHYLLLGINSQEAELRSLIASKFKQWMIPYSLLTTRYSLLPAHYSLLPAHYSLLPTHYSLLPAHYSLLTAQTRKLLPSLILLDLKIENGCRCGTKIRWQNFKISCTYVRVLLTGFLHFHRTFVTEVAACFAPRKRDCTGSRDQYLHIDYTLIVCEHRPTLLHSFDHLNLKQYSV